MRALIAFAIAVLCWMPAWGQDVWPSKPVRLLVGFAAGGPTDLVARVIAQRLTEAYNQPFIVENRPGANGLIAVNRVLSSSPDGYTLLVGTSGALTVSPAIVKNWPTPSMQKLTPISILTGFPYVLAVSASAPVTDLKGLVLYAKQHPSNTSFSSSVTGSVSHLAGEWFANASHIEATHIPYKGASDSLNDLMSGRVLFGFNTVATAMPQVAGGQLRAIAVTTASRTDFAPGVPTLVEQGYAEFVIEPWNGLFGPLGMDAGLASRINKIVNGILSDSVIKSKISACGQYVIVDSPLGMANRIKSESARWQAVVNAAKLQPE